MAVETFACLRFVERRASPALALVAILAMTIGAMAQGPAKYLARECALQEIMVITAIEDHGITDDLPADQLGKAGLRMLDARMACSDGRVGEALALYESVLLNLGPVASARLQ
ncbi:hypothetical protein [Phreatobacter stygius]|uniref:Uncharacterized protein n=1 Tax=Phreatobacter stygius TaxID=1940610 RepID=A0A4D7AY67_9HYPH|nr:hypothetical protein [Phreatobacter stygius]QCI63678.1 hypothetical protein E8M01_05150 [Phreatobacter stygius]